MSARKRGGGRASGPGKQGQGRSAITGRYVKPSTVRRHPDTTVNESRKKGK